jgi:cytochrome c biogenesis protein CcdA/thiol-disulfide isomerase/thioredoxin
MILFLVSFVSGVLTVLAPCILPLLPVIIGGSIAGKPSTARALRITLSLGVSVFLFTLILKVSTAFIKIPQQVWTSVSAVIILITGIFMIFPTLWEHITPAKFSSNANRVMSKGALKNTLWGDIIVGAALGPVFSSCSPTYFILLAVVLPAHPLTGLFYLISYIAGLCLSLFFISFVGQRILDKLNIAADPRGIVKRSIGLLFVLLSFALFFGLDKKLAVALPSDFFGAGALEQKILDTTKGITKNEVVQTVPTDEPNKAISIDSKKSTDSGTTTVADQQTKSNTTKNSLSDAPVVVSISPIARITKSTKYQAVPELVSPDSYLNTGGSPITLAGYKGKKVVLVDFWTYSCINCLRTVPELVSLYGKYKDQGLEIVGVHTPEFAFEKLQKNVEGAITKLGITYPVVQDNGYKTWNNFNNKFWPHVYLVDIDGYVVYDHIGEGGVEETEKAIQKALMERAERLGASSESISKGVIVVPKDTGVVGSPETYFGANRNEYLANGKSGIVGIQTYTLPTYGKALRNKLYLGGTWNMTTEAAQTTDTTESILYRYHSSDIYFVASANQGVVVEVLQDGKPIGPNAGEDVDPVTSTVTIKEDRLYKLVHNSVSGEHVLELRIKGKNLNAFTFTFG